MQHFVMPMLGHLMEEGTVADQLILGRHSSSRGPKIVSIPPSSPGATKTPSGSRSST